jgi:indolepyruvate ferredoxin oxidoreductase alpha subunit
MPGLVNAVYNQANFILVVFDNDTTAMTGFQPHPGVGKTAMGDPAPIVSIEAICRSLGIRVEVCDPFDLKTTTDTLVDMMKMEGGVRVIIMKRECELTRARREPPPYKVHIDPDVCQGESCVSNSICQVWACPALLWDNTRNQANIDDVICAGCGVCADICPQGAIVREAIK